MGFRQQNTPGVEDQQKHNTEDEMIGITKTTKAIFTKVK